MNAAYHRLLELINDPVCVILMERDGVKPRDIVNLMRSIKDALDPTNLLNPGKLVPLEEAAHAGR